MNKLLKIIIIFLFILLIYCLYFSCFANIDFTYNNTQFSLPDFPSNAGYYKAIAKGGTNFFYYFYSSEPLVLVAWKYGGYNIVGANNTPVYYAYKYDNNSNVGGFTSTSSGVTLGSTTTDAYNKLCWANHDIYYNNNIFFENTDIPPESYDNLPYFLNSEEDIAIGEQDLIIMPGDFPNTKDIKFVIQGKTETEDGQGGIIESWNNLFSVIILNEDSPYYYGIDETGVGFYYKIPWSFISNYLTVSHQYDYILAYTINGTDIVNDLYVTYGGLTPEDAIKNSIANQTKYIQQQSIYIQQQTEVIQQQTQAIEDNTEATQHLENTITDDTIESTADDLPSIDVSDPTQNGIDNIFQSIYNAFCVGEAQDIVFPIPFTNKNITLSPYYVRDMLNNNGANWVYLLIQAFWGYLIGRYIVKDISHKITKIKSGDIENIQNDNIKEEML